MTKYFFVALLVMFSVDVGIQAQGLPPRRTLGRRLQRPGNSAERLASATNEAERATLAAEAEKK